MSRKLCQHVAVEALPDGRWIHECRVCGKRRRSRVRPENNHAVCAAQTPGLGDWLAGALARVGLSQERWGRWRSGPQFGGGMTSCRLLPADPLGRKCACERCATRQETVNRWGWRAVGLLSRLWPRSNRKAGNGGTAAGSPDRSRTGAKE